MKLIEKYNKIQALGGPITVPWEVKRFIGSNTIEVVGDQLCICEALDCDYGNLEEVRGAIAWYVEQLGGKVKWSSND